LQIKQQVHLCPPHATAAINPLQQGGCREQDQRQQRTDHNSGPKPDQGENYSFMLQETTTSAPRTPLTYLVKIAATTA
jgi:hypothetical protein